jgi:hypothetical protein
MAIASVCPVVAGVLAMKEGRRPPIAERLADHTLMEAAVRRAVREALLAHARAGNPVASWEDGKVVWIQPDEILARLAQEPAT